jgi:putative endopeptidase
MLEPMKILLAFLLSAGPTTGLATTPDASSDIPAKRDFPLNKEFNPCQNFHDYVCSKAEAAFKLRDDRSFHIFSFYDSRERILEQKKKFMKELPGKKKLPSRTQQIRATYLACMDEKASVKAERAEVSELVKKVSALKNRDELLAYANKNMPTSDDSFLYMWSNSNLDDPHKLDAILGSDFMRIADHKYYENPELLKDYQNLLADFFKTIYGKKITNAEAQKKAEAQISLQKDFIKIYPQAAVRRQRWSERRISTQAEFLKKYPNLKIEMLFKLLPKTTLINTPIPESLEFLNSQYGQYSLEVWKDVYLLKKLDDTLDDGYPAHFNTNFEFEKKYFGGPAKRSERQERCTKWATTDFTKELDAILVEVLFPKFDEAQVQEMGSRIRKSIIQGLEKNIWLSPEAKIAAIEKIKNARLQLVKPHTDREWDFNLERKYSEKNRISNQHTFRAMRWEKMLKEFQEPANMDAWGMGPLTVNAYYNQSENKFVVPMGILQYPFFDSSAPLLENLGAIGAVMGHELGHAIDDNGSNYDSEGKLKPWMSMKDLAEFNRRSSRLVEFFNKAGHDGALTLGENVADLVGLSFAYDAAFANEKPTREDQQRFFVSYARTWCSVARPDYEQLMRKTDPHSAGWARINEQVKHQAAFAEAFSCKAGDAMSLPEKDRMKIW